MVPEKLNKLLSKFHIPLTKKKGFIENKDIVLSVYEKRNSIIHKNSNASEISLQDILQYADIFKIYGISIIESVESHFNQLSETRPFKVMLHHK